MGKSQIYFEFSKLGLLLSSSALNSKDKISISLYFVQWCDLMLMLDLNNSHPAKLKYRVRHK